MDLIKKVYNVYGLVRAIDNTMTALREQDDYEVYLDSIQEGGALHSLVKIARSLVENGHLDELRDLIDEVQLNDHLQWEDDGEIL
jgi:hypothetical protein